MPAFFISAQHSIMRICCIIPAAGKGTRIGGDIPKQFLKINGIMIIEHAIRSLFDGFHMLNIRNASLVIACEQAYEEELSEVSLKYLPKEFIGFVRGGKERMDSIINAVNHPLAQDSETLCIHDAARPFIPSKVLHSLIESIQCNECVIPVLDIPDTVKEVKDATVIKTIDRSSYKLVQTPQFVRTKSYHNALNSALREHSFTDDASIMEYSGHLTLTVNGSDIMRKVTTPYDLLLAELHAVMYESQHGG